jgi:hypothetical protein
MKLLCLFPALILMAGCDQRSQPLPASSSISLSAFKGSWEGAWVWKPSESSTLIFDGNQIKLKNFPIDIAGKLEVLNSEALAEEPQGYGASNTLALLARPKGYNASIAIFAYGDSSGDLIELRYSVREHLDERIIFRRSEGQ